MNYLTNLFHELNYQAMGAMLARLAAVFLCLTVHETSHALAALALGDPTAKAQRRISFNPLRHIDWFGLAAMVVCGFGWAKPVPVDSRYFRHSKSGMALTALAGPVSNLLLSVALLLLGRLVYYHAPDTAFFASLLQFLLSAAVMSIGLGVFNLFPLPPLDGSKVLAALLPDALYETWMRFERIGMLLVFALVFLGVGDGLLSRAIYGIYSFLVNLIF